MHNETARTTDLAKKQTTPSRHPHPKKEYIKMYSLPVIQEIIHCLGSDEQREQDR